MYEDDDDERHRPTRRVRHRHHRFRRRRRQVDPEVDRLNLHSVWRELGRYAEQFGDVQTVRDHSDRFSIGSGQGQRNEQAGAKIVAKFRKHLDDPDYVPDARRRERKVIKTAWYIFYFIHILTAAQCAFYKLLPGRQIQ